MLPNKTRTELLIYRDRSRTLIPYIEFDGEDKTSLQLRESNVINRVFVDIEYVKGNAVFETFATSEDYLTVVSPEVIAEEQRKVLFKYLEIHFQGQLTIFQYLDKEVYIGNISAEHFRLLIECGGVAFKFVQDDLAEIIAQKFGENFIRPIAEKTSNVNNNEGTVVTPRSLFESLLRDSDQSIQDFLNSPRLTRTTAILLAGLINTVIELHTEEG